jgi:predicted nucleic acid-binding protein
VKAAYVDTSCVVAIAFGEPGWEAVAERLGTFEVVLASNLLEAELAATLVREGVPERLGDLVAGMHWVLPDRSLTAEIQRVARAGHLRGADLWHLACALLVDPGPADLAFLTLDEAQARVARVLGFRVG